MIMPRDKRSRSLPIYLTSMTQIGPDMQVYQSCIGVIYIFSTTIIWKESMNFDTICGFQTSLWHEICARAQPYFLQGTGLISPVCLVPALVEWYDEKLKPPLTQ